jgi:urease accessory protein
MIRASAVQRSADLDQDGIIDRVVLGADERHRRRIVLTGEAGTTFLLDLPQATALRDGDGLVLEDGSIVQVVGKPEAVLDIEAANATELARLAWHLGNRHTEVQIIGQRLRIRRDHVLEAMVKRLGAKVTALDAPFDPESGAYGASLAQLGGHDHARTHGHADPPAPGSRDGG